MLFEFGRYIVDVDLEKTKEFYDSDQSVPTNEACSCDRCQRFPKAILSSSNAVLDFLHCLGIDPTKAGEVIGSSSDDYWGWYHVVGTLIEGRLTEKRLDDTNAFRPDINTKFKVWFEDDPDLMGWIEDGFPSPVLEIFFNATLPISHNQ